MRRWLDIGRNCSGLLPVGWMDKIFSLVKLKWMMIIFTVCRNCWQDCTVPANSGCFETNWDDCRDWVTAIPIHLTHQAITSFERRRRLKYVRQLSNLKSTWTWNAMTCSSKLKFSQVGVIRLSVCSQVNMVWKNAEPINAGVYKQM